MFQKMRQRIADTRTLAVLCEAAEKHANADGQTDPGAEHFMLAALDLPDGTASSAFRRLGADPRQFRDAVAQQYGDALETIGLKAIIPPSEPVMPNKGLYQAKASAQALVQQLAKWPRASANERLTGAHVIAVAAAGRQGVAVRALRTMGVDLEALGKAARAEISAM